MKATKPQNYPTNYGAAMAAIRLDIRQLVGAVNRMQQIHVTAESQAELRKVQGMLRQAEINCTKALEAEQKRHTPESLSCPAKP